MADEDQDMEEGGGGGGIIRLLIVVIPALLIGLGGGYFLGSSMVEQAVVEEEQKEPKPASADPTEMVGEVFSLDPFVVNLNESRGNRYLKTTISLEMSDKELLSELERREPQIRDMTLALLTSKNTRELQALEGKFRLREELISRVNAMLINGHIKRVYFTEFVIQ